MDLLKMSEMLTGILPVLPTPFTADGDVDLGAMPELVRYACDAGVGGVVFPGFASEVEHLSPLEREELLKIVVEATSYVYATPPTLADLQGHTNLNNMKPTTNESRTSIN